MKNLVLAIIAGAMIAGSSHAFAQSASGSVKPTIINAKRLDALDKRNAKLEKRKHRASRTRKDYWKWVSATHLSTVASAAPSVVASTSPTRIIGYGHGNESSDGSCGSPL